LRWRESSMASGQRFCLFVRQDRDDRDDRDRLVSPLLDRDYEPALQHHTASHLAASSISVLFPARSAHHHPHHHHHHLPYLISPRFPVRRRRPLPSHLLPTCGLASGPPPPSPPPAIPLTPLDPLRPVPHRRRRRAQQGRPQPPRSLWPSVRPGRGFLLHRRQRQQGRSLGQRDAVRVPREPQEVHSW
jgi:hypothetical protein